MFDRAWIVLIPFAASLKLLYLRLPIIARILQQAQLINCRKLKSHRILQRLSDRGVIKIEKYGKTNIVKLTDNIKEVLIK